ncbi:hypothetical protein PRIPAC_95704 [Pristionchus pacificus]|uniref:Uncharacterized protein n=1 Tax=Pristionchus pacificus TaxID=54126 RepID=A0A2A6D1W6_PRIPA|nr:hypothetical protein PRIPAC_95704 [Pristionchus pacificus]|eukprot:PDM84405.1 hypothetical protein PRIPAC_33428 [Pristionchus pacificus]
MDSSSATEEKTSSSAVEAKKELLVSRSTVRQIERNSEMIFTHTTASKGSLIGRVSMYSNELLRQISQYESIRALAVDIGKIQETVVPPALKIKPPLDFGDDSDGMENMASALTSVKKAPIVRIVKKEYNPNSALFRRPDDPEEEGDVVRSKDDITYRHGPTAEFRPFTPEEERMDYDELSDPSPPPSPIRLARRTNIKKRKRSKQTTSSEEEEEEEDDYYDDAAMEEPEPEPEPVTCSMCDMIFYAQHQLDSHLVSYHRMKATGPHMGSGDTQSSSAIARQFHHTVTSKPIINGVAKAIPGQPARYTATTVTSPGGTVRTYSNPSNAARAAAKAAAAAANGTYRPTVPPKPYTCRHCGVLMHSQQMYASHVRYAHPKNKPNGETEGTPPKRKSSGTSTAIVHLQMEDGTKIFQCRRCEKTFDSAQKVAGHSRHCLLVFEGKARPSNQGPIPTEDRPYTVYRCGLSSVLARTCPYCGELLPSIRKVDKHVRMEHDAGRHEVYGCTTCDRRFVTLGGIENHWLHYGDCPNGVLTVHSGDTVTCADIGPMPSSLNKPKPIKYSPSKDDVDPSEEIVNSILGQYGFRVNT